MRKFVRFGASVAVAAAVAGGSVYASMPANAQDGRAVLKPGAAAFHMKYNDRELLQLLLAGVGPVADANPAIVRYLGFSATRPKVNMAALDRLVTDYLRHDKTFHAQVLVPVQSGDPARVEVALTRFSKTFLAFMKASLPPNTVLDAKGNLTTTTPALAKQAMAQGVTGFKLYVAAAAVVLANAVVYANVGVATNAVATLVIVWWYLMEDPAQVNDFERQQFVSLMTNSLRGR